MPLLFLSIVNISQTFNINEPILVFLSVELNAENANATWKTDHFPIESSLNPSSIQGQIQVSRKGGSG